MDHNKPRAPLQTEDKRSVYDHLNHLDCTLFSEVEPVSFETKLYAVDTIQGKVGGFIGCKSQFDELRSVLGQNKWEPKQIQECKEIMDFIRAHTNSLLE